MITKRVIREIVVCIETAMAHGCNDFNLKDALEKLEYVEQLAD